MMQSSSSAGGLTRSGCASDRAPPPATASNVSPVARFDTIATAGAPLTTRHSDVANHGSPSVAFVEPSSGSTTTMPPERGADVWCRPDSSDNTSKPAPSNGSTHNASTSTSTLYWPGRSPDSAQSRLTDTASRVRAQMEVNSASTDSAWSALSGRSFLAVSTIVDGSVRIAWQ